MTPSGILRSLLVRLAWLAVAALIAFGSAGVVAAMHHQPGSPARPELTYAGDAAATPALDAATRQLQGLADDVDGLAAVARQTLTTLIGGDLAGFETLITRGTAQVGIVDRRAAALEAALEAVPGMGAYSELTVSEAPRRRYEELVATSGLTAGLEADWAVFTGRAVDAARLATLLARHDEETAAAAKEGTAERYTEALALLARSDATIAEARALAERLGGAVDGSMLTTWLDRNAGYDRALRNLYAAVVEAKGRNTDKVRAARSAEAKARSLLPADTRGLVLIMVDVAQGGLNQAVIRIEEARGSLAAALAVQELLKVGPALPG